MPRPSIVIVILLLLLTTASQANTYSLRSFKRIQLTDKFWTEAAAFGDLDRDGYNDIVAGPYWYAGPDFKKRHAYSPATQTFKHTTAGGVEETVEGYEGALGSGKMSPNEIFVKIVDLNGDGWPDIIRVGYPPSVWKAPRTAVWYENPGARAQDGDIQWTAHVIADQIDNQSMDFVDLFGDGKPVLIAMSGGNTGRASGRAGYFRPDPKDPTREWTFHPISQPSDEFQWYTHGLGYGDINGDGRNDVLHSDGWWEQPASVEGDPVWTYHTFPFNLGPRQVKQVYRGSPDNPLQITFLSDMSEDGTPTSFTIYGGSQMHVDDVNGDGLPDVVTSIVAHGYGLAWWEQLKVQNQIGPQFKRHMIVNKEPSENKYGVKFSEMQALEFVDVDGDGLKDIVTGKRFWGHGKCCLDPESNGPAVLYWFKQVRHADKTVEFIPYLIDADSGAGTQLSVGDVDGDGLPDIVVANTKGVFVFLQKVKNVSKQEWEAAQPAVLFPRVQ